MIFHTIHICKSGTITKVWQPGKDGFQMVLKEDNSECCQNTIGHFGEIHFFAQEFPDKSRGFNFQMGPWHIWESIFLKTENCWKESNCWSMNKYSGSNIVCAPKQFMQSATKKLPAIIVISCENNYKWGVDFLRGKSCVYKGLFVS